jgi:hypothetical protein
MSDDSTPSSAGEQPLTPPVPPAPPAAYPTAPPAYPAAPASPAAAPAYPTTAPPAAPTPSQAYPGAAPTYGQAPAAPAYHSPAYPTAPAAGYPAAPQQPGYAVAPQQPVYGAPGAQPGPYPVYGSPAYPVATARPTSGLAITSLICAIVSVVFSWLVLPILAAIAAVVTGHMALKQTRNNPAIGGRGVAFAGLIIGYIMLGFLALTLIMTIISFVAFGAFTLPFLYNS